MKKLYSANGFVIQSDVILLGWKETEIIPQSFIPLSLTSGYFTIEYDKTNWPHIYKHPYGEFCFNWGNKLAFLVTNNYKDIIYMMESNENPEDLSYAINFVLSFIAVKYNRIPFHACAVADSNNSAIMILGQSGIGKSTLLFNLLRFGYKYVSEEICFAYADASSSRAFSGNKVIRLNEDMYTYLPKNQLFHSSEKICFWNSSFDSLENSTVLKGIFILERNESLADLYISKICKSKMIESILTKYLYTRSVVKWLSFSDIINAILKILKNVDCYLINCKSYLSVEEFEKLAYKSSYNN